MVEGGHSYLAKYLSDAPPSAERGYMTLLEMPRDVMGYFSARKGLMSLKRSRVVLSLYFDYVFEKRSLKC